MRRGIAPRLDDDLPGDVTSVRNHTALNLVLEDPECLAAVTTEAVAVLKKDGVLLVPTDTVYGLVCRPSSKLAVQLIFVMKRRPFSARLPIIVNNLEQAMVELPLVWNPVAIALAHAFWPGPMTIACAVRPNTLGWLHDREEAAVRAPAHALIQSLTRTLGPLLMTSANQHGEETPHTMKEALAGLSETPHLSVDGGRLSGAPSTLVNANLSAPAIEREGAIPAREVNRVMDRD